MIINATKEEKQMDIDDAGEGDDDNFADDNGPCDFANDDADVEYSKIMAEEMIEDDDENLVTIGSSKVDSCVG